MPMDFRMGILQQKLLGNFIILLCVTRTLYEVHIGRQQISQELILQRKKKKRVHMQNIQSSKIHNSHLKYFRSKVNINLTLCLTNYHAITP